MTTTRPQLSQASLDVTIAVVAYDEHGQARDEYISAERPLTVYLDKREIVTLMTMGREPEMLVLGWLKNQNLLSDISQIKAVQVDWQTDSAAVVTYAQNEASQANTQQQLDEKLSKKTVTTGCGQGTVFGGLMDNLENIKLPKVHVAQQQIYALLNALNSHNEIYKKAGAVHGCALCKGTEIISFVEDVGRHNAVDAIAGRMWLDNIEGGDKWFYTTGRLTSEMVIKVGQMGIPVLLSRSGVTQMGWQLAKQLGVVLIARAKGKHFLVYNGIDQVIYDE